MYVRVNPSGRKTFVYLYRAKGSGKKQRYTIGTFGTLTVDEARVEAKKLGGEVAAGGDPVADRKAKEVERKAAEAKREAALTFAEYAERYMERAAKRAKRTTTREKNRVIRSYLIPAWGALRLEDIRRRDVTTLHERIGARNEWEADQAVKIAKAMFNDAMDRELIEANPAPRKLKLYKPPSATGRRRPLKADEMRRLVEALGSGHAEPVPRDVIRLLLYTGMRRGEALGIEWRHVDMEGDTIELPTPKTGRYTGAQVVVLSSYAVAVLRDARRYSEGARYVFPGSIEGRPLTTIQRPWERLRDAAGLEGVMLKDLRSTCATWIQEIGHGENIAGAVLRHSGNSITARNYTRIGTRPIRAALEAYGREIERVATGQTADVVELHRGA